MGELICIPEESLRKRMLIGGLLTFGMYAIFMWFMIYRNLPKRLDGQGITLMDGRRFKWKDITRVRRGQDLAIWFGETCVSILPADLENGGEVRAFAEARIDGGPRALAHNDKVAAEGPKMSSRPPSKRKTGSNLHFVTTFAGGMKKEEIQERLKRRGLKYDEKTNTLQMKTTSLPPFEHVRYTLSDSGRLKTIVLEFAYRGEWPEFEDRVSEAMFSLEGTDTLREPDGRMFEPPKAQARLESATKAAGVRFEGRHQQGKLTGELRARAAGYHQAFVMTVTWTPAQRSASSHDLK